MPASIKVPATFTAIDKFSHVVRKMTAGVQNMTSTGVSRLKRLDARMDRTFKGMSRLSQIGIGMGIGALFINSFNDLKQFETGLVGVGKTTGMTDAQLKKFGMAAIDVSNNLRGVQTSKILELSEVAGQLGISDSAHILKFSETLAKLEKASDIQGEEGATSIARLLKITGEGPGIVDRFSSALVGLGNNTEATESQILSVASEVARSTSAYGLSSKEILGLSAAMTSMGVAPEAAGTAIFKTFLGIEKATISGGKQLRNYAKIMGLSANETKSLFASDKQAAFLKLISGLSELQQKGGSVTGTLKDLGLSNTTIVKGITPLVSNYEDLTKTVELANTEFSRNKALNEEFGTASNTMQTAINDISKSYTNLLIKTAATGSGLEMVQKTLFFVSDNMEVLVVTGASLVGIFGGIKAALIAAKVATVGYNVVLGLSAGFSKTAAISIGQNTVALGAYKVAQALSTGATWLATTATTAFGIALNAGLWPITLVIAAIAGLIALFYNWDSVTAWFSKQWKRFTAMINVLWDQTVKWFQDFSFTDFFKNIGQSIMQFMFMPLKNILQMLSKVKAFGVGDMATSALGYLNELDGTTNPDTDIKAVDSPMMNTTKTMVTEKTERNEIALTVKDDGNKLESVEQNGPSPIGIYLPSTQGMF